MSALDREHIRKLLDRVEGETLETSWDVCAGGGPQKVFVYDEEELLDLMVRIATRSFGQGVRFGSSPIYESLSRVRLNRGEQR